MRDSVLLIANVVKTITQSYREQSALTADRSPGPMMKPWGLIQTDQTLLNPNFMYGVVFPLRAPFQSSNIRTTQTESPPAPAGYVLLCIDGPRGFDGAHAGLTRSTVTQKAM